MNIWVLIIVVICVLAYVLVFSNFKLGAIVKLADYDRAFDMATRSDNVGGLVVGVVGPNGLEWSKGYGTVGKEKIDKDTIFRVASISKMFTAIIALMLVRKGIIKLSDCISNYVKEIKRLENIKGYQECITFHQLLSQTSGIDRSSENDIDQKGDIKDWEKILINALEHTGFTWKPGTHYEYSNMGYAILGLALENAFSEKSSEKKNYFELVNEWIFKPCGMTDTSFEYPVDKKDRVADARYNHGEEFKIGDPRDDHQGAAAVYSGVYSTVSDLAKFISCLMGDKLLTKEEKNLMFTPQNLNPLVEPLYGLGTEISQNREIVGHSGALPGYKTQLGYHLTKKKGVIILRNYFTGQIKLSSTMMSILENL